jgi:hypothetical protein
MTQEHTYLNMKPFHTNQLAAKVIVGVAVHVMYYIEPTVIIARRLPMDVLYLMYSEVSPKRSMVFAFLTVPCEGPLCEIMNKKLHE